MMSHSSGHVENVIDLWNSKNGWIPGGAYKELAQALGIDPNRLTHHEPGLGRVIGEPAHQVRERLAAERDEEDDFTPPETRTCRHCLNTIANPGGLFGQWSVTRARDPRLPDDYCFSSPSRTHRP